MKISLSFAVLVATVKAKESFRGLSGEPEKIDWCHIEKLTLPRPAVLHHAEQHPFDFPARNGECMLPSTRDLYDEGCPCFNQADVNSLVAIAQESSSRCKGDFPAPVNNYGAVYHLWAAGYNENGDFAEGRVTSYDFEVSWYSDDCVFSFYFIDFNVGSARTYGSAIYEGPYADDDQQDCQDLITNARAAFEAAGCEIIT